MKVKMFSFVVAFACFALSHAAPQFYDLPRLDGRIVGGEAAFIEEYPYQVSLLLYSSHRCGGVIVSEDIILTAAHCTFG